MISVAARYFPGVLAPLYRTTDHCLGNVDNVGLEREATRALEMEISDEALVLRLQEKDISGLGLLYRRYARLVYSLSSRIIRDPVEAEDLVHEVFLSLYRRCGSFDPAKGTVRSWLVQLTYHKCFDWRDYLKSRHGFQQGYRDGKEPHASLELTEDRESVEQLIDIDLKDVLTRLPREQQLAFKLRAAGYTFLEIAEKLGCTEGNAKNRVYRGMRRLRQILFDGNERTSIRVTQQ